jgi:hypothetical protein
VIAWLSLFLFVKVPTVYNLTNNSVRVRHAGLDPASRNTLDPGLRRDGSGFMYLSAEAIK